MRNTTYMVTVFMLGTNDEIESEHEFEVASAAMHCWLDWQLKGYSVQLEAIVS